MSDLRSLIWGLIFIALAGITSCEDEPILDEDPTVKAKGSYGRLGNFNQNNDTTYKYRNPEVF